MEDLRQGHGRGREPADARRSPSEALGRFRWRRLPPPLEVRLKRRFRTLRQLHRLLLSEFADRQPARLATRLRALRRGFTTLHWRLYGLDANDPADYVPSFAGLDFGLEHPHFLALCDKLTFARVMERLAIRHPAVLAFVERGCLVPVEPDGAVPDLGALLARHGTVVVKPVSGGAGSGVDLLTTEGGVVRRNGCELPSDGLSGYLAGLDQALVTEFVRQGAYAAAITPHSTNTVRILTVWDVDGRRPFIAAAAHRIGLARTYPIDNFHGGKGGISAPIDLETGTLGDGVTMAADGTVRRFATHPETGAPIAGVAVPGWRELVALTVGAAAALPHVPYVGWDLVVTDEGPSFLEANSPPGTVVWEVHGGLLADPRVRRFYRRFGLLQGPSRGGEEMLPRRRGLVA